MTFVKWTLQGSELTKMCIFYFFVFHFQVFIMLSHYSDMNFIRNTWVASLSIIGVVEKALLVVGYK